jgi:hypothetical protein
MCAYPRDTDATRSKCANAINAPRCRPITAPSRNLLAEKADSAINYDVLTVTLSCDHRVIDGALGGTVLAAFKSLLESPVSAIV